MADAEFLEGAGSQEEKVHTTDYKVSQAVGVSSRPWFITSAASALPFAIEHALWFYFGVAYNESGGRAQC